jgi:uncharacterized protein (DUF2236 family)
MDALARLDATRSLGESVTVEGLTRFRIQAQDQLRRALGIPGDRRAACDDPDLAYFEPDSVTRRVHSDLPPMLIGGLAALLFQMLHPLAMAGVAQHSNYRKDPLGRLERTAMFLGTTTFGSRADAEVAIARVRRVHDSVVGVASDGRPYAAGDPDLLTWVHAAEVHSFLTAALVYGPRPLARADQDRYVDEMSRVAYALGAVDVPRSTAELAEYFVAVRPELRLTPEAKVARNFVLRGVGRWPHEVTTYGLLIAAAQGCLPTWARRQLRLAALPAGDKLAVRPAARMLSTALRWVATPVPEPTGGAPDGLPPALAPSPVG